MIREFLKAYPYLDLAVAGQVIFFLVFVAAIFWVFRSGSGGFYERLSRMPFEREGGSDE
jgi:hypothetical protein